jgi:hypothetical protein
VLGGAGEAALALVFLQRHRLRALARSLRPRAAFFAAFFAGALFAAARLATGFAGFASPFFSRLFFSSAMKSNHVGGGIVAGVLSSSSATWVVAPWSSGRLLITAIIRARNSSL